MARIKGSPKTGGRAPGTQNKITVEIKDMVRQALDGAGGVDYLKEQAVLNPGPFMALIGKIIPSEVNAKLTGGVNVYIKQFAPPVDE